MEVVQTDTFALHLHVCVPLIWSSVEKAPTGCILRCHHTAIQTAQHGHHIVLDGACNSKVLKEPRPAMEQNIIFIISFVCQPDGIVLVFCFLQCILTCFWLTTKWLHSQNLLPHWDVSLVLGEMTGSHCCSAHPARWSTDWCPWLWNTPHHANRNLKEGKKYKNVEQKT